MHGNKGMPAHACTVHVYVCCTINIASYNYSIANLQVNVKLKECYTGIFRLVVQKNFYNNDACA